MASGATEREVIAMSRTITTNGTIGIYLADPLDNPVMVAASGTISTANGASGYAILGSAAVVWTLTNFGKLSGGQYGMHFEGSATIANRGTMVATGTKSTGVLLQGGGRIVNGAASFLGAQISGSYLGVQIAGDAGTVINLGTITSSDMPGSGAVALMQGGTVTNGSTAVTGALISGGGAAAVYIIGGTSALVTNQGTIAGQGNTATAVELWSGGTVINGSPGNSAGSVTLRARVGWPGEPPTSYYPTRVENGAMRCLECDAADVSERRERTTRGYRRFRCRACGKQFNERSGGILNRAQYPSDVIALVIFWRLRYKLSLRDLPEMFLIRGIEFSYEAVRDWEAKLTPTLIDNLRRRRTGRIGKSW